MKRRLLWLTELTRKQFAVWSKFYDSAFARLYFEPLYQKTIELFDEIASEKRDASLRVLDVACGTGEVLVRLQKRQLLWKLTGTDLVNAMLEKAKKKNDRDIHWVLANVTQLPFDDRSFDIILCSEAFHHFFEPEKALAEISRVLSKEGIFILIDPAANTWIQKWFLQIFGRMIEIAHHYYSKTELSDLLAKYSFSVRRHFVFNKNNFFVCEKT